VRAFVPPALPPDSPARHQPRAPRPARKSERGLGRLDGLARLFPIQICSFTCMSGRRRCYLRRSRAHNRRSPICCSFENKEVPGVPTDDVKEVSNYVAAMNHGLERLREVFPCRFGSSRRYTEILMSKGRGHTKAPGEFRTSQNWIGGSRPGNAAFVPPPPNKVMECMGALEKFLHDEPVKTPLLSKQRSPTCSSRPSIHFSTATAGPAPAHHLAYVRRRCSGATDALP